ncbi:MAG: MFS transporter [Bdellovibrionota bacterium]
MSQKLTATPISSALNIAVLVSALGYFVDIYDLLLFSIVRVRSLTDLGLSGSQITDQGLFLINVQMIGLLLGGILFGILGDKKGRLTILFGSILLYSIANLLNSFVQTVEQYAVLRFIAGVGLAGELGAGVALVSESMSKETRGYGTMVIASVGLSGAALAWAVAELFDWRTAFFIGGIMGLALLFLRLKVFESGLFDRMKNSSVSRGHFLLLFTRWNLFKKYISTILVAIQTWYIVGILITLSPEFTKEMGVVGTVEAGKAVLFSYLGISLGDLLSGLLSQLLKSRIKVFAIFLVFSSLMILLYFSLRNISSEMFYVVCFFMGFSTGYWAIFVTMAAERFGTNIRATVATTAPNFVRGSLVPISWLFAQLKPSMGLLHAGALVGLVCVVLSFWGLWMSEETFAKDLDYFET